MKQPQWLERLRKKAQKRARSTQEVNEILGTLAGSGKNARQRVRPKDYKARKKTRRKMARESRRINR